MKTGQFQALRTFCAILIVLTVLANIAYFGFFCWNYKTFEIERTLKYGEKWTMRSFSLYFVYLNILCAFLFGYAFNIGSKYVLKIAQWVALAVCGFGVFATGYAYLYAGTALQVAVQNNLFSPVRLNTSIIDQFQGKNLIDAQEMIMSDYGFVLRCFQIFECANIVGLGVMMLLGRVARFIEITCEEEEVPPIVSETAGDNVESLRPVRTLICVQM